MKKDGRSIEMRHFTWISTPVLTLVFAIAAAPQQPAASMAPGWESAIVTGFRVPYFMRQIEDMKSGDRRTVHPNVGRFKPQAGGIGIKKAGGKSPWRGIRSSEGPFKPASQD